MFAPHIFYAMYYIISHFFDFSTSKFEFISFKCILTYKNCHFLHTQKKDCRNNSAILFPITFSRIYASLNELINPNTIPRTIAHAPIPMIEKK